MRWYHTFLTVVAAAALVACGGDSGAVAEVAEGSAGQGQVNVVMKLRLSRETTRSGTDSWGDNYTLGAASGIDNYIDPSDIQVALYKADDNTLICKAQNISMFKTNSTVEGADAADDEFTVSGVVPASLLSESINCKVMVVVNSGNAELPTEGLTAQSLVFARSISAEKVPMWGVSAGTFSFAAGEATDIGQIDLLRAMAKVEVELATATAANGYTISAASVSPYNESGYALPAGFLGVQTTTALTYAQSLNVCSSAITTPIYMTIADGSATCYLTEYTNSASNADNATIALTLAKDGTAESPRTIYFRNYDADGQPIDGSDYSITRNHCYRFTVSVEEGLKVKVSLSVQPWATYTHAAIVM